MVLRTKRLMRGRKGQMLAFDRLSVPFARAVYVRGQMPGVRAPIIGIKTRQTKGLQ